MDEEEINIKYRKKIKTIKVIDIIGIILTFPIMFLIFRYVILIITPINMPKKLMPFIDILSDNYELYSFMYKASIIDIILIDFIFIVNKCEFSDNLFLKSEVNKIYSLFKKTTIMSNIFFIVNIIIIATTVIFSFISFRKMY